MTAPQKQEARVRASQPLLFGAWVLVALATSWVLASAFPAVARGMGLTELRVVRRDFDRSAPQGRAGIDAMHDFEQEKQDIGRSLDRLDRGNDDDDSALELVLTARETTLRQTPSAKGIPTTKLAAGVPLIIISRSGVWIQVAHQTANDSLEVGWLQGSDVATR